MEPHTALAAGATGLSSAPVGRMAGREDALQVRPALDESEWAAVLARVAHPHLTQAWMYGEAKRAGGWHPRRLVLESAGRPLALCQVLEKRVLGVPVLHRVNRGPLFVEDAVSPQTVRAVMRALRETWRGLRRGVLLIAPALEASEESRRTMIEAGFRFRSDESWQSAFLDLRRGEAALRRSLSSAWRNHLKVSERSGLVLRVSGSAESVEWMLARHAQNMRAKGFAGPAVAFVRAMAAARPGDRLVFQALHAGEPVAGCLVLAFGGRAEYYLAWYSDAARRLSAGNFLVWNAAIEMARRGCAAFDLGGYSTREKYGRFKEGMRGVEYRLAGEWIAL